MRSDVMRHILAVFCVLVFCGVVFAADRTFTWEPATAESADATDSYTLYYKLKNPDPYVPAQSISVDLTACTDTNGDSIHDTCTYTWVGLPDDSIVQRFVVTAINTAGESGYSNEVAWHYRSANPARITGLE